MTFDEQLQRSLGTVSDHLRDEMARALLAAGAEVTAHANQARDAAADAASARAREAAEATARVEITRLERQVEEMTAASASLEQRRAADAAACQRLVEAVRALDRASSLSDILDALVDGSSREAARVGLLLARQGELRGWRFIGFDPAIDSARSIVIPAGESGIVGEAVRTGGAVFSDVFSDVSSDASGVLAPPAFAGLPGNGERLAVPVVVSGDVAAVLYADHGIGDEEPRRPSTLRWPDAIELLARHAARCLEATTAIKAVRVLTDPPEISADASSPASANPGMAQPPDSHEHELRAWE